MPQLYTFLDFEPFDPSEIRRRLDEARDLEIPVRRPFMGLEINRETHATLHILFKDLNPGEMVNTSDPSGKSFGTANFIITHVKHSRSERVQISESFANMYLHTFGEQPKFVNVRGALLKSRNFPWRTEWLRNYDNVFRASRTIEDAARVYLTVEDTIYEGHMLSSEVLDQAETPNVSPLQFVMLLTNVIYGTNLGPAQDTLVPVGDDSVTRVSSSEYVNLLGRDNTRFSYAFDQYGNIIVIDDNRVSTEQLNSRLAIEEAITALANELLERILNHPLYPGSSAEAREERSSDLVEFCRQKASDLISSSAETASDVFERMSGWTSGEDRGDQASRRSRNSGGRSHGSDVDTSEVSSSEEIITDEQLAAIIQWFESQGSYSW